jgi:hypothetical protein
MINGWTTETIISPNCKDVMRTRTGVIIYEFQEFIIYKFLRYIFFFSFETLRVVEISCLHFELCDC